MKKLINDPQNASAEFLAGLALAHADILKVCLDPVYVVRAEAAATNPCMRGTWAKACSTPLVPERYSRLQLRTKSKPPRARSTGERAFYTSSRTTPATS